MALSAAAAAAEQRSLSELRAQGERPDDPPGQPARPVPGADPAQPVTFGSFTSVQVNVDLFGANIPNDAANEPSIAVDPTAPLRMAIGWRQFDTISSNFRQAGYGYSVDGGRSWIVPGVLDPGIFRSDPVLAADANGNFYYNSLRVVNNVFDCFVFVSTNGGASWGAPVFAYGGDKLWMTVDRTASSGSGHVYQAWSTASNPYGPNTFSRSTDGAATFSFPSGIPNTPIWGTLDVDPEGTLYVSGIAPGNPSVSYVAVSTNAKNSLVPPTFVTTAAPIGGSVVFSSGPNPAGLLGQLWVAVNPVNKWVYLCGSVNPPGSDPLDVMFASSSNGSAWNAPVRVNDDATTRWQWFGTMSVAPNGRIDVVWNDTRNHSEVQLSELYYSFSTDNGVTWAPNQQLTPTWDSHVGFPNQSKIGDYYHMVSDNVGAHLAWAATFNGEQDVYYLRIGDYDCNGNSVGDSTDIALGTSLDDNANGIPDECEEVLTAVTSPPAGFRLEQSIPNPFNPGTMIHYEVPDEGAWVTLSVYDVTGRRVRTLIDGEVSGGAGEVYWNGTDAGGARVASGVYIYRLQAPGYSESRRMVLLK